MDFVFVRSGKLLLVTVLASVCMLGCLMDSEYEESLDSVSQAIDKTPVGLGELFELGADGGTPTEGSEDPDEEDDDPPTPTAEACPFCEDHVPDGGKPQVCMGRAFSAILMLANPQDYTGAVCTLTADSRYYLSPINVRFTKNYELRFRAEFDADGLGDLIKIGPEAGFAMKMEVENTSQVNVGLKGEGVKANGMEQLFTAGKFKISPKGRLSLEITFTAGADGIYRYGFINVSGGVDTTFRANIDVPFEPSEPYVAAITKCIDEEGVEKLIQDVLQGAVKTDLDRHLKSSLIAAIQRAAAAMVATKISDGTRRTPMRVDRQRLDRIITRDRPWGHSPSNQFTGPRYCP